jgi:hypothetical protein
VVLDPYAGLAMRIPIVLRVNVETDPVEITVAPPLPIKIVLANMVVPLRTFRVRADPLVETVVIDD